MIPRSSRKPALDWSITHFFVNCNKVLRKKDVTKKMCKKFACYVNQQCYVNQHAAGLHLTGGAVHMAPMAICAICSDFAVYAAFEDICPFKSPFQRKNSGIAP